jgi:hypothetical protein
MGFMYISTLARVRRACNQTAVASPANPDLDGDLMQCLAAVSTAIQTYMSRWVQVQQRTEFKSANPSGVSFLDGAPVRSVVKFEFNDGGVWQTFDQSQYYLIDDNELHYPRLPRGTPMRVTYAGGMAYSVDTSIESVTSVAGTPATGEAFTTLTGATGKLVAFDSVGMTATIQIATGGISYGDILTGATSHAVFALGTTIQESVLSDFADLAKAADMQTAYLYQRRNSLGRTATTSGNGTTSFEKDYELLPGVIQILEYYDPQASI